MFKQINVKKRITDFLGFSNQTSRTSNIAPEEHIPLPTKDDLLFLPLGGSGEVGMNVNLYGTNKHWIMVDLGITFNNSEYGIDFITANLELLKKSKVHQYIKGVVVTHSHEDHIGGIHEIWPYFKFHIYLTKFSKEILLKKLENKPYLEEIKNFYLHEIPQNKPFVLGDFLIEFIDLSHSIPEANGLWIKTPKGNIFHTGDWKIDKEPVSTKPIDVQKLKKISREKVDILVCDSTNVLLPGVSGSEKEVLETFKQLFKKFKKGKLLAACFASNIDRIKSIADAARINGRKVCLLGKSIIRMTDAADKCRYPIHLDHFISEEQAEKLKPHEVMYVCTGSQGDENSALARIARGVSKVKLSEKDVVFFSSKTIPGNERRVNVMMNNLARIGVKVVTSSEENIHVSGHPCRDELTQMYDWLKPKFLVPVHGEIRHLMAHKEFAQSKGIDGIIPENGTLISLLRKRIIRRYDVGRWGMDGKRFIDMQSSIIKERETISLQGAVFITIVLAKGNRLLKNHTTVTLSGLVDDNNKDIIKKIKDNIESLLNSYDNENIDNSPRKKRTQVRLQAESLRSKKVIEHIRNTIRSIIGKTPYIRIHWIYQTK